ncbi:uncharacterized protein F5Z01DRAFT_662240 [Emericellopsis atlantica]|uniref:S-adenosyl-L-methionine-dependent methyltransferase n=1 Tax=Emericellopsis atlantica TaxID=2614577 RepID=A0A9P7ZGP7_9HYPO|nr:uncharacterized protein F5Z01DRAFT_662240 [Emericellopsis atlantica]KAG9251828.1 hypothetical protein F5Z01DRAFT_662240 [Emericellopsis atlantica]
MAFSGRDVALSFVGGFLAALIVSLVAGVVILQRSDARGLGHWKLNAKMPLATMWMNLGYWTRDDGSQVTTFEEATSNLLRQILLQADLISPRASPQRSIAILDVGFGCGDQTWALVKSIDPSTNYTDFRYIGLTLDEAQTETASRYIYSSVASSKAPCPDATAFKLFCADASVPKKWAGPVHREVEALKAFGEKWFLALDCIYYFSPSRRPIMDFSANRLGAGFMAFDLLMNPEASRKTALIARLIGVMMGCPFRTFLTQVEYERQLVDCGYPKEQIEIRDITEHVFPGIVRFLDAQDRALSQYGISLGGYKLAGRLFDWFGRSGALKAVIVVARAKGSMGDVSAASVET